MSFWDVVWFIVIGFGFAAYLITMFSIVADLFRDRTASGGAKALWILGLFVLPLLTALVYVVVKGKGMAERSAGSYREAQERQETYIRQVAGTSAPDQIEKARSLLDSGIISASEFDVLKAKALGV
ncbi:phospholipase D-like protein [Kribbella amoyensis]|uniref:Phospholipase D-like protein n=1 Tax=Kribbella amoyensis TaxID=996641 RepID=A0A561BYR0_9ACTN|nr:SHOCT domain-containing protein [Kribbella amoyensis]TWD84029.1 phospholipase D-like protein [Kribbella amoyensis]